jgi:hypothetical protein
VMYRLRGRGNNVQIEFQALPAEGHLIGASEVWKQQTLDLRWELELVPPTG